MSQLKFKSSCMAIFGENPPTFDETKMIFLCYQQEIAPETKNLHWQTYVEFKDKGYGIKYCQKYLNAPNCHLESRKGTPEQARNYTKNNLAWDLKLLHDPDYVNAKDKTNLFIEGSYKEFGDINNCPKMQKGKRSDISKAIEQINNGAIYTDLDPEMIVKYSKGMKELINIRESKIIRAKGFINVEVTVLWGDSEAHKSRTVYDIEGYDNVFTLEKTTGEIYFDKYAGEKVLLLDDFYGWIPWCYLLRLLDGYPMNLNVKFGSSQKAWEKVYITSNSHFTKWYPNKYLSDECITDEELSKDGKSLIPLQRRIKYMVHMTKKASETRKPIILSEKEFLELKSKNSPNNNIANNEMENLETHVRQDIKCVGPAET